MRYRGDMGDQMRCVAAVPGHPGHLVQVLACESGVAPATAAIAAGAAEPADAGARPDAPAADALAERIDDADHLVAGDAGVLDAGDEALHGQDVAMTDAASLDANAHFVTFRHGNVPLLRLQLSAGLVNRHRAHFRHLNGLLFERNGDLRLASRRRCGWSDSQSRRPARRAGNRRSHRRRSSMVSSLRR